MSTLSASDVGLLDKQKKTSWKFGIKLSKVAGYVTSLLFSLEKNLRLEWFIKSSLKWELQRGYLIERGTQGI